MASIYTSRVEAYGRYWYRPWLVFLCVLGTFALMPWLAWLVTEEPQVACSVQPGSRFRGAVEIDGLLWTADLQAGLACALKHKRRVLVAFHGMLDTNARINEVTAFRERAVQAGLKRYVLVKLYTDYVPDAYYQQKVDAEDRRKDGLVNLEFEQQQFNTSEEPMYVVLQPRRNGKFEVVGVYAESQIKSSRFIEFLRDPLRRCPG